jgi:hypothetical protein
MVFVIFYLANLFGPPPPSLKALKITALCGWLFVPWFYWIDRHRPAISVEEPNTKAALSGSGEINPAQTFDQD